jgi:hypothetical protein
MMTANVSVECTVSNTGARLGDEVVQVYHQVSEALRVSITKLHPVPLRRLIEFERVTVAAGKAAKVAFPPFNAASFALVSKNGSQVVYPGQHSLVFSRGHGTEIVLNFTAPASSTTAATLKTDDEGSGGSDCAGSLVLAGKTSSGFSVCEDLTLNGSFVFQLEGSTVDFGKRVYPQHPQNTPWASSGDHDAVSRLLAQDPSGWLLTGARLTDNSTADPIYDEVLIQAPPIRASQFSSLRFTGSREARMDVIFDHRGGTLPWNGQPSPENVLHESIDYSRTFEGLVGGELPIVHYVLHESAPSEAYWEVTAVPKPENDGSHEQVVFFRFQRILKGSAHSADGPQLTLDRSTYFETYQYVAGAFTAEPEHFWDAMLAQRTYWDKQWEAEGMMRVQLPAVAGTDGKMLSDQAQHGFVKDMITRTSTWWPRYGVGNANGGGYEQAGHSAGFQEIFSASMMAALTWGADSVRARPGRLSALSIP